MSKALLWLTAHGPVNCTLPETGEQHTVDFSPTEEHGAAGVAVDVPDNVAAHLLACDPAFFERPESPEDEAPPAEDEEDAPSAPDQVMQAEDATGGDADSDDDGTGEGTANDADAEATPKTRRRGKATAQA